ncbi:MAG: hypothetical protein AAEJ04_11585 [Planctomycetota bacterium]
MSVDEFCIFDPKEIAIRLIHSRRFDSLPMKIERMNAFWEWGLVSTLEFEKWIDQQVAAGDLPVDGISPLSVSVLDVSTHGLEESLKGGLEIRFGADTLSFVELFAHSAAHFYKGEDDIESISSFRDWLRSPHCILTPSEEDISSTSEGQLLEALDQCWFDWCDETETQELREFVRQNQIRTLQVWLSNHGERLQLRIKEFRRGLPTQELRIPRRSKYL